MRRSAFLMTAALAAMVAFGALAQQSPSATNETTKSDPAIGEKLRASLKERASTRPLKNPPPIGVKAREIVAGKIDWIGMKTELAISARRDSAAANNVTAVVPRPGGLRATAPDRFKGVQTLEVNRTRLPVLAPEGGRIAQTLKVYSLGDAYSAVAEVENGVAMRLSGSARKIVIGDDKLAHPRIAALRKARQSLQSINADYIVTRSESSTDLSFAKFGAGYVLSLMCDDPADARCADDSFIVKLASNLLLLNPEAGGE